VVDKLLLTTNASYIPSGTGVTESPTDAPGSVSDNQAPGMPAGLSGNAVNSSRIDLSWSASTDTGGSGLAGYRIYRDDVEIGTTTVPSYSDTALAPATPYSYSIEAYDNAGNVSVRSNTVTVFTDASGTSGTAVGSATISWNPPTSRIDGTALTDLAGYTIHYGNSSGNYTTAIDVNDPLVSSYVVENLPSGTFYFAMTASDTYGNSSAFSNEAIMVINN